MKLKTRSIRDLETIALELYSSGWNIPDNAKLFVYVNEIAYENLILTKRLDVIGPDTLRYISTQGVTLYVTVVSDDRNINEDDR